MTLEDVMKELLFIGSVRLHRNVMNDIYCTLTVSEGSHHVHSRGKETPLEAATECLRRYRESVK